jgi:hypothetical protein
MRNRFVQVARTALVSLVAAACGLSTVAQQSARVKVAEGEFPVSEEGDLGMGPMETEIFHFRESWTLWRVEDGEYEFDGNRIFESPRDVVHENHFAARLAHDFRVLQLKEFA